MKRLVFGYFVVVSSLPLVYVNKNPNIKFENYDPYFFENVTFKENHKKLQK